MKFLVTGGSGFLGKRLIEHLIDAGHEVVLLGRTLPKESSSTAGQTFFEADIIDIQSLEACKKAFPDISGVVHMAALVPKNKEEDEAQAMLRINAQGTLNLLEVFGESIHNFVYASTAEVYGLPVTDQPLTEASLPAPLSYYGASKLTGELFCNVYAQKHNLPISLLRFTVLYGPGDTINRAIPNFIKKALAGENLDVFGGEELRDYLHVNDAAEALYLAATTPVSGVFNIGTGKGITIKSTAESIIQAVNPELSIKLLPREKKAADIVLDISAARQELGFTPKYTFPDLIEEQIEWHKHN